MESKMCFLKKQLHMLVNLLGQILKFCLLPNTTEKWKKNKK